MKKRILSLVLLLGVLLPLFAGWSFAYTPEDYEEKEGIADALISEAFTPDQCRYTAGTSFDGYSGRFSLGWFRGDNAAEYTPYTAFSKQYDILCQAPSGNDGNQWTLGGMYLSTNKGRIIFMRDVATAVAYTAPRAGLIDLSFDKFQVYNQNDGSGVYSLELAVFVNGTRVFPASGWQRYDSATIDNYKSADLSFTTLHDIAVQEGDRVTVAIRRVSDGKGNYAYMQPKVTYTAYCGETYRHEDAFAFLQGRNHFYAMYGLPGRTAAYAFPAYDDATASFGGKDGAGAVYADHLTVTADYDTVVAFVSPLIGRYTLSVPNFATDKAVTVTVTTFSNTTNDTTVATRTYNAGDNAFAPINGIALDEGDAVAVRFHAEAGASVSFAPVMQSEKTVHAETVNTPVLENTAAGYALRTDVRTETVSLSLSGTIAMNFGVRFGEKALKGASAHGLLVSRENAVPTVENSTAITAGTPQADGSMLYVYSGLTAKEMTDTVYFRAFVTKNGETTYDEAHAYSIRQYAETLRARYKASESDVGSAIYALSCAMLNYGAAAQTYHGYRTGDLANAGLTDAEKAVPAGQYTDKLALTGKATLSGASLNGATLVLEDVPHLAIFASCADPAGITLQMSHDPSFATVDGSYPLTLNTDGHYYAKTGALLPGAMRTNLYFRLTDGTNVSTVLTYSAETYAARIGNSDVPSATTTNALFGYTDAAVRYAEKTAADTVGTGVSATEFIRLVRSGELTPGATYTVRFGEIPTFDGTDAGKNYDLRGVTVRTAGGIEAVGVSGLTLSDFTLTSTDGAGNGLLIRHAENVTLSGVTVNGKAGTAVALDAATDTVIRELTVAGNVKTGLAISETSAGTVMTDSEITAANGVSDASRKGIYASDNTVTATGIGFRLLGNGAELRYNTVNAATAVSAEDATYLLIAATTGTGAFVCDGCDNVSAVKNAFTAVDAQNNTHLYVTYNTVTGSLTLKNNDYLLADANTCATVIASNNQNQNGDSVTDVNARLEVGADETLLPQIDKDQYINVARSETVRTADGGVPFLTYILSTLAAEDEVFLAPGAYSVASALSLSNFSDKAIYAYGVIMERGNTSLGQALSVSNLHGLTIEGLVIAYSRQSCGQVYVLDKIADNKAIVVTGAGMINEFGNTDKSFADTTGMGAQRAGTFYAYCDTGFKTIAKNDDGTMIMTLDPSVYNMIAEGDILTCRVSGGTSVSVNGSTDVTFKDMTIYGEAGGFAFVEGSNRTGTTYYRVIDTTRSAPVIDKDTYDRYAALENTYGVSLEISVDERGNYRGSPAHIGSIDATHTTKCAEGSLITSCLFENMCDDGTNQNATHARLHAYSINGDTVTLTYKGNFSEYSYYQNGRSPSGYCYQFAKGDRVYIYTSAGQLVCDGPALTAAVKTGTTSGEIDQDRDVASTDLYQVTVALSDFNEAALQTQGLSAWSMTNGRGRIDHPGTYADNLGDNHWYDCYKVLVDNMSMASNGFLFDNTVIRNIRSRGLLIKASGLERRDAQGNIVRDASNNVIYDPARIINCTLENIGMGAVAIHYEIYWGESGVSEHLLVKDNLIRHTGYFSNRDIYAPVSILGLGSKAEEDFLLYKDITITGNKIENRCTTYAVYVNSAKNVTITDNDFGYVYGTTKATDINTAIHINGAQYVTISGNVYPDMLTTHPAMRLVIENAKDVSGSDVPVILSQSSFAANLPTEEEKNKNGWTLGAMNPSTKAFTQYAVFRNKNGWAVLKAEETPWNPDYGGIWTSTSYRYAAQSNSYAAYAYTVPESGKVTLGATSFLAPSGDGAHSGYYGIFVGTQQIGDWFHVTTSTTLSQIQAFYASISDFAVTEGQTIYFAAKVDSGWSNFAIYPIVTITEG